MRSGSSNRCQHALKPSNYDISYMVASHLQGDFDRGEEGGCGLISGLDCRTCLPAPMDFAARVLI